MLVLVIAITIHEFAHAIVAYRCGDDTPRGQHRLSLNPIDHLSPIGTLMMAVSSATGFGIGWGKPVQYQPGNLNHPRWDPLKIAIAGPISNVLQALIFAGLIRLSMHYGWLPEGSPGDQFLADGVWVNLALTFFNFIPVPPLDGSKILSALLPLSQAQAYDQFMGQWSFLLFFVIAFTGLASVIIGPPIASIYRFLVG